MNCDCVKPIGRQWNTFVQKIDNLAGTKGVSRCLEIKDGDSLLLKIARVAIPLITLLLVIPLIIIADKLGCCFKDRSVDIEPIADPAAGSVQAKIREIENRSGVGFADASQPKPESKQPTPQHSPTHAEEPDVEVVSVNDSGEIEDDEDAGSEASSSSVDTPSGESPKGDSGIQIPVDPSELSVQEKRKQFEALSAAAPAAPQAAVDLSVPAEQPKSPAAKPSTPKAVENIPEGAAAAASAEEEKKTA